MGKKKHKEKVLIAGYSKPMFYAMIAVLIAGPMLLLPALTYPFHIVRCGKLPITASKFAAGYDYMLPGDYGYLGLFNESHFCSESEAKDSGYHRTPSAE